MRRASSAMISQSWRASPGGGRIGPDALDAAVGVGVGAVFFGPAGGGEDDIGDFGGFGHEDVLDDQEVEMAEVAAGGVEVGVGHQGVFAHDEHAADVAGAGGLADFDGGEALAGGELRIPLLFEVGAEGLVLHGAIVGEVHGDGADVAGALDVVLAAQGVEAGAAAADVAGGEGEVDEGEAGLGAVGVLGDAESPVEGGLVGLADDVGGALEGGGRDAGEGFLAFGGPVADGGCDGVEILDAVGDEFFVHEAVADDDVEEGVVHGDVGAGTALEVDVGPAGEFDGAGGRRR